MTNLLQRALQRSSNQLTMDQWADFFTFGGLQYPYSYSQTLTGHTEEAVRDVSFEGLIQSAYKNNGVVFACMLARQKLFSEARFQFRPMRNGRPGELFGTKALAPLENPWPGGVTGDLLTRAIQDVDLAGNFFCTRRIVKNGKEPGVRLRRMRPDYVTIIIGSFDEPDLENGDLDAEVVGYIYHPGGRSNNGREPIFLLREQVAHFAPIPDPSASFRGMSWLVPIIREYMADTAMITHKSKFLEQGATPNMVVTMDPSIKKEAFKEWVQMFSDKHEGVLNAYKTLYLGAGASVLPVGKDFRQMEFAVTQAVGETRICAAAAVPPVLVGVTEGIRAATYSNYQSAKRYFGDATLRPLWRNFSSSMQTLIDTPENADLWYDDRDIPFLYDDAKDRSEIMRGEAATIKSLVDSGYEAMSCVEAVINQDFKLLKHTGLFSVQLLPPGAALVPNVPTQMPMPKPANPAPTDKPSTLAPATPAKTPSDSPKATPATPAAAPKKASLEDAVDLLSRMAEKRRTESLVITPAPPPVNVDIHFHEGAFRSGDSPVTVDAQTHVSDGAFRVDSPVTIEHGAVQIEAPVTVEPSPVTIAEGAFRGGDTHVAAPEVELRLVDGAIQVHAPVTISEGAVRVEAPPPANVEFRLVDGAIQVHNPVTIERGAVQVDSPVTVERTEVHIDDGAVRVSAPVTVERTDVHVATPDVHVTVERSDVNFEPGSISVPVNVERTEVHIDEGAVRVDSPVTVERTEVHLDPGSVTVPIEVHPAEVNIHERAVVVEAPVTVERTEVHIDEGAVRIDAPVTVERTEVHVDDGAIRLDAPVTVNTPDVHVEPAQVTIERGAVQVDAPVTISDGAVRVDAPVTLGPDSVRVTVDAPTTFERGAVQVDSPVTIESGAVQVDVEQPVAERTRKVREVEFRMDDDGRIVGKREVETDEPS